MLDDAHVSRAHTLQSATYVSSRETRLVGRQATFHVNGPAQNRFSSARTEPDRLPEKSLFRLET